MRLNCRPRSLDDVKVDVCLVQPGPNRRSVCARRSSSGQRRLSSDGDIRRVAHSEPQVQNRRRPREFYGEELLEGPQHATQ